MYLLSLRVPFYSSFHKSLTASLESKENSNPRKKRRNCENKHGGCKAWADEGYCEKSANYVWMKENCCSSCSKGKDNI